MTYEITADAVRSMFGNLGFGREPADFAQVSHMFDMEIG
jgi:hypothetical protein